MTTATATEALTATDLEDIISATKKTLETLAAEQRRLSLAVVRKAPGATESLTALEAKLASAREAHRIASDAIIALGEQEAAEKAAQLEADRAQLEAARAETQASLSVAERNFEAMLADLAASAKAALVVGGQAYNAGVALGIHGDSTQTMRALEARVNHELREVGLTGFDQAINPAFRVPLGTDLSKLPDRVPPQATALPERKDIRDMTGGYPGQNLASRPILQTFLKDAAGEWVEVPIGAFEFPTEPVELFPDDDLAALREDAARRSAKRRSRRSA